MTSLGFSMIPNAKDFNVAVSLYFCPVTALVDDSIIPATANYIYVLF